MAKEAFGFVQGVKPKEKARTWKNGPFTFTEKIVPGVVYLYNCKFEFDDGSVTAPTVQSTPRLSEEEVEARFAEFVARASKG